MAWIKTRVTDEGTPGSSPATATPKDDNAPPAPTPPGAPPNAPPAAKKPFGRLRERVVRALVTTARLPHDPRADTRSDGALTVVSSTALHAAGMKITDALKSQRLPALAVSITVLAAVSACGGTGSTTSGAGPTSSASASDPSNPSASVTSPAAPSSSASAAESVAPVPVESNPPGDIPDNLAFVKYTNKPGGYAFTHPEGWAQTGSGTRVRFTDKLNGVTVDSLAATQAPTVASARSAEIPRLQKSVPAFQLRDVSAVTVPGGSGVHIVFRRNSDPDAVTGRVYRDEVEEYLVFKAGRLVRMDLYGPVGADNVDAYRTMSQSLSIR